MISKAKKPNTIGKNEELPEGIFGVIEAPKRKRKAKAKSKAHSTLADNTNSPQSDASTKNRKTTKSRVAVDASSASGSADDAPRIIGLTPPTAETPKADKLILETDFFTPADKSTSKKNAKIVIEPKPKPLKKKKKRLKVAPIAPPPKAKVVTPALNVMPKLEINYDSMMPPEAEGLPLENVVSIPDDVLKRVAHKTEKHTKELSKLLLNGSAPAMLSYDAASNYVKAVLSDGLKIDVDIDRGVLEVVKDMARLDVIFFYLKRLAIPRSMKKQFMSRFIEELSKASLETMHKTNKSDAVSSQLRELEAVVMKRSEHQARENGAKARTSKRIGLTTEDGAANLPMTATKKTRRDGPMMGGF